MLHLGDEEGGLAILIGLESDAHVGEAACLVVGSLQARLGRWSASERSLKKALEHRQSPEAWCLLHSTLFRGSNRQVESLSCLRRALEVDDTYEEAHANLAMRLRLEGAVEEAEVHAKRAVELDPNYGYAFAELGALRLRRRDAVGIEEGLRYCKQAVEHSPQYFWGWLYLAVACWKGSHLAKAEAAYAQACELAPDFELGWRLYSDFVLKARRDPERAQSLAARGLAAEPSEVAALDAWTDATVLLVSSNRESIVGDP